MKEFEAYYSEDAIVSYLCKLRAKVAKSRNKKHLIHLLTESDKFNYHVNDKVEPEDNDAHASNDFIKYQSQFLSELNKFFPGRKKWASLGEKSRRNKVTQHPISATDRNYYSLIKTIKAFQKKSPNELWLIELNRFVLDIQESISCGKYQLSPPIVYPKLKDDIKTKEINKCRPISMFSLKDRIILSITNKYLTALFDKYFSDCSYAFRSKKNILSTAIVTHHDCIKELLEYRVRHIDKPLWVVECDMEKFYDSVNHTTILDLFNKLIQRTQIDFPELNLRNASHIFCEYLNCYAFNKNVPEKSDLSYWESYKIPNGEFGWVEKEFKQLGYYEDLHLERIGVPQGGALSGLIANIVLDVADKGVLKNDVFYTRFCDDMLIIHPELDICEKAKADYLAALNELKLVPHEFNNNLISDRKKVSKNLPITTFEHFWKGKSKGPYRWASINDNGFPWIGFVGYELHFEGHVRVRKKSFHKELEKQEEVVEEIRKAVKHSMRRSKGSVTESAIHRLVGMSVGRVTIKNFDKILNDLCWKNGFKELAMNKYSVQQIKQLDRNRSRLYYDLLKDLKEADVDEDKMIDSKPRQVIHFNKPFSYFYQILERKEKEKSMILIPMQVKE